MGTVVGLFENRDQAQRAAEALKDAGFRAEDISIVMRDKREAADLAESTGTSNAAEMGTLGGGLLGGALGFLVGIGALAIPGIGPIIAAGPLVASLAGGAIGAATGGLIGALVEAGVPEEEAQLYSAGVERGGILLSVNAPQQREAEARQIMQRNGMRDASSLRSGSATTAHATSDKGADKTTGGTVGGAATGAVIGGVVGGPVGAAVGAAVGGAAGAGTGAVMDFAEDDFRADFDQGGYSSRYSWDQARPAYEYGWKNYRNEYEGRSWNDVRSDYERNWRGQGNFSDYEPMIRTAYERRGMGRTGATHTGTTQTLHSGSTQHTTTTDVNRGGEQVIPVVEEELRVGKREVERGGVRVDVDVEEKPVEEQVRLREERVNVERRPVDREVSPADAAAFREGTIEVTERAEEAVVDKRARVVEEVVISKEAQERTETIRDTVRRTDVDVEQIPGQTTTGQTTTSQTSGMSTTGVRAFEDYDNDFRSDYNTRYASAGRGYDYYNPAYRYGYNLATHDRYRGRNWSEVEPEARRYWEERNQGTWEDFKDSVRYAWDKVTGQR